LIVKILWHDRSANSPAGSSPQLQPQTYTLLGITVLLTQLPLLFHLPLYLTLPGMLLTLARLVPAINNKVLLAPRLMTPLVLLSAIAVVLHYGNFFARDPCVVFLFLLINFKFIETNRRNDASLIVVLCAFLLLTQFFYWQTIAAALLAIPSMFMIGLALFSLQRGSNTMSIRDMVHVTSKLFVQAMPVAIILFVAVPRLPTTGGGIGENSSAVTGLSSSMQPGSVANLTQSNAVAFRVEFDGAPPFAPDLYWRGPVLSGFDGSKWFIDNNARKHYEMPTSGEHANRNLVNYTVTVEPTSNPWLLALDTPISLPMNTSKSGAGELVGHLNHERQIETTAKHASAFRYRISSSITDRFTPSIAPTSETLFSSNTNPATRRYIDNLRQRFSDDEQLVNQILLWFNQQPFHYTLQPQSLGKNEIDEFLFSTRQGFCEHYAGSLVFMLRVAGIPARVITGYQGGEMNGDYMIVRQSDAHAWVEAFIKGQWRRYDPTAAVARERVESGFNAALGSEIDGLRYYLSQQPIVKQLSLEWDAVNYKWQTLVIDFDSRIQTSLWNSLGLHKPDGWQIATILALAVGLWTLLIVVISSIWRRTTPNPCEIQWKRLQRKFSAHGINQSSCETATRYTDRLSQQWPEHSVRLQALLTAYQHGRYSEYARTKETQRHFAHKMKFLLLQINKLS